MRNSAEACFETFAKSSDQAEILANFVNLCTLVDLSSSEVSSRIQALKRAVSSWRCQDLCRILERKVSKAVYSVQACRQLNVVVLGGGLCGLRYAIEVALSGANVTVVEKRTSFSRNNVLHLWPYLINDLKNLGAKDFYSKFCTGCLDHISIRQLQCILLRVALLLGVKFESPCEFVEIVKPSSGDGWRIKVLPEKHPVSGLKFDVVACALGKHFNLYGFPRKEFRGKLAIAITCNFVNRNTVEDLRVPEISGVASIYNQAFFLRLRSQTGIDLENIVYYKDDTHYFVMTAKKHSLLAKGVLIQDHAETQTLLDISNINRNALLSYAREAAEFSTDRKLQLEFVKNKGMEDVSVFDFTSIYAAENSCRIFEKENCRLLVCMIGDALLEPFWPTGSGCARGFLSCFDAAWAAIRFSQGSAPLSIIQERESLYRLLPQTTPSSLLKDYDEFTVDPSTRYCSIGGVLLPLEHVKSLYQVIGDKDSLSNPAPLNSSLLESFIRASKAVDASEILSWCKKSLVGLPVTVNSSAACWKNGVGFCALIHRYRPDLINMVDVKPKNGIKNCELAFSIAEDHLGIPVKSSPLDICGAADPLSIMSFLEALYVVFQQDQRATKVRTQKKGVEKVSDSSDRGAWVTLTKIHILKQLSQRIKKRSVKELAESKKKSSTTDRVMGDVRPIKVDVYVDGAMPQLISSSVCCVCGNEALVSDRLLVEARFCHRACFYCRICFTSLNLFNYEAMDTNGGRIEFYCTHDYQLASSGQLPNQAGLATGVPPLPGKDDMPTLEHVISKLDSLTAQRGARPDSKFISLASTVTLGDHEGRTGDPGMPSLLQHGSVNNLSSTLARFSPSADAKSTVFSPNITERLQGASDQCPSLGKPHQDDDIRADMNEKVEQSRLHQGTPTSAGLENAQIIPTGSGEQNKLASSQMCWCCLQLLGHEPCLEVDGRMHHVDCFRCFVCGCPLTIRKYHTVRCGMAWATFSCQEHANMVPALAGNDKTNTLASPPSVVPADPISPLEVDSSSEMESRLLEDSQNPGSGKRLSSSPRSRSHTLPSRCEQCKGTASTESTNLILPSRALTTSAVETQRPLWKDMGASPVRFERRYLSRNHQNPSASEDVRPPCPVSSLSSPSLPMSLPSSPSCSVSSLSSLSHSSMQLDGAGKQSHHPITTASPEPSGKSNTSRRPEIVQTSLSKRDTDPIPAPLSKQGTDSDADLHEEIYDLAVPGTMVNMEDAQNEGDILYSMELKRRSQVRLWQAQVLQRRQNELEELQRSIECMASKLETTIRQSHGSLHHQLMGKWLELVHNKNTLVRLESDLVIEISHLKLLDEQERLEVAVHQIIRCAEQSSKPDSSFSRQIDRLVTKLLDVVNERNYLVQLVEDSRLRDIEEDKAVMIALGDKAGEFGQDRLI